MSTNRIHMAIPNKPTTNPFLFDRKPSKLILSFVSSSIRVPIGLIRSCTTFQYEVGTFDDKTVPVRRRSGNYRPPIWDYDFIQSLSSEYKEDRYLKRASELVVQMNKMLNEEIMEPVGQLEFIDDLQRLGISYHFYCKIKHILNRLYDLKNYERDLYSTSLGFRLMRQHGFSVSQDVFDCYKNDKGVFEPSLADDTKGLLQLYEASFLLTQGEKTLELAREFATKFLEKKIHDDDEGNIGIIDEHLSLLVHNALEIPLHWRSQWLDARWFINAYKRRQDMNPIVLELAKLDFNILQATHQDELKHVSRWWKETCLSEKLPFARNELVECYYWTFCGHFEPQYGYPRVMSTKVISVINVIDDMFDVYGTLEELHLFNDVIQRWDIEAMDKLPYYMQVCFLALNNLINELAYHVLKEQGFLIIAYLRKSWADLCQQYLEEAKWYSMGYTPTMDQYMDNACISAAGFVVMSHEYFLVTNPIDKEAVQSLYSYHNIVRYSGLILRLANDLGTSTGEMERGDVAKSIQCYMNESGASKEDAREYVRFLIYDTWRKMNEELRVATDSPFQRDFVRVVVGVARAAILVYQHENRPGVHFAHMKDRISGYLFDPINE